MVTVKMAIDELDVKRRTVYQWLKDATEEQVHRERHRLPDERGRMVLTLVVDLEALRHYGDNR